MLTILLALWLAACVAAGNLQYGLRSYGAMVAACAAAVIAMAGYNNPPHLHDLVFGRIACHCHRDCRLNGGDPVFYPSPLKTRTAEPLARSDGGEYRVGGDACAWGGGEGTDGAAAGYPGGDFGYRGTLDAAWAGSLDLKRRKRHVRS